jgi:hypothetical protein
MSYRWWRYIGSRGASFPVKKSEFDAVLDAMSVTSLHSVALATSSADDVEAADYFRSVGIPRPARVRGGAFRALGSGSWRGLDPSGIDPPFSSSLRIYSVPRELRAELGLRLRDEGLPLMLRWVRRIETGPETVRTEKHRLAVYLYDGRVESAEM